MKLLSIQVGKVQTHEYNGKPWVTGYRKMPVSGSIYLGKFNLEGDEQHHTKFHGGEHRAVLMYASEHYDLWQKELGHELPFGSFAENLTVSGMTEDTVCIGDIYGIGDDVQLQIAQPRQPCHQIYRALGIRGIVKRIQMNHRSGWYCRVLQPGIISEGMSIKLLQRLHPGWDVIRAHRVMANRKEDPVAAQALAAVEELEPGWRKRLGWAAGQ